ncbi:unnamed protein product [Symbiodinium sp. KB8]|nr:unnamed protein product [Symbiodinium sp. KB8]
MDGRSRIQSKYAQYVWTCACPTCSNPILQQPSPGRGSAPRSSPRVPGCCKFCACLVEGSSEAFKAWKQNQSIEQRSLWAQDRLRRNSGGVLRGDAKSYECGHAVVDTLSMDGLEGPEEVKEVLRLISRPEHEGVAPSLSKEEDEEEGVEANLMSAEAPPPPPEPTEEPELIRIAQEAAREADKEPSPADLLHFAKRIASEEQATSARLVSAKRDARFDAMDRELGEAVAEASTASPFRGKGSSSIRQKPSARAVT